MYSDSLLMYLSACFSLSLLCFQPERVSLSVISANPAEPLPLTHFLFTSITPSSVHATHQMELSTKFTDDNPLLYWR